MSHVTTGRDVCHAREILPGGAFTDIVANSHNGFFIGAGEDFLAMLKAIAFTWPMRGAAALDYRGPLSPS